MKLDLSFDTVTIVYTVKASDKHESGRKLLARVSKGHFRTTENKVPFTYYSGEPNVGSAVQTIDSDTFPITIGKDQNFYEEVNEAIIRHYANDFGDNPYELKTIQTSPSRKGENVYITFEIPLLTTFVFQRKKFDFTDVKLKDDFTALNKELQTKYEKVTKNLKETYEDFLTAQNDLVEKITKNQEDMIEYLKIISER